MLWESDRRDFRLRAGVLVHRDRETSNAESPKWWSREGEFGILRKGEVQGRILRLGNGTGGHHERCS
jgi:hypothetical protein